jgi:beta-glucosidase
VKDMMLTAADKAAVDKVCSAVRTCVVSVVSGRPLQIDRAQRREIDALVASWLPGSEGEGVADVLFGNRPFTARLPMTWPKTVSQEPINVGDAHYAPLYPYGWGLRTGSVRAQLRSARNALAAAPGLGHAARAAVEGMNRLLRASAWRNGSLRPTAANLRLVRHIARRLDTARVDSFAVDDALVSVVRDVAIGRSGSTAVSTREAKAVAMSDHALAGQHVRLAVVRLERLLRQQQRGS